MATATSCLAAHPASVLASARRVHVWLTRAHAQALAVWGPRLYAESRDSADVRNERETQIMEMLPEHLKGQSLYDRSYQKRTDALTAAAADPKWAETWQELGQGAPTLAGLAR